MLIVFDTETTGLTDANPDVTTRVTLAQMGSEVVQIGGLIVHGGAWDKDDPYREISIEPFCYFLDCISANLDEGAMDITHIDMRKWREEVNGYYLHRALVEGVPEMYESNCNFIGHNIMFDIRMMNQTLRNSGGFKAVPLQSSILPRKGRWAVDTVAYTTKYGRRQKLTALAKYMEDEITEFRESIKDIKVRTNSDTLLNSEYSGAHNALTDAICTFVVWRDLVWRRKIV